MTIQDLGSIGELIGAVATVATLVYLAIQIRSNTTATRSGAAQAVHESFSNWYNMLASDESLSALVAKGLRDYESLTEAERARFVSVAMSILLNTQDAFIKWREGSLIDELWISWEFVIMNLVKTPGGGTVWQDRKYLFGAHFRDHVETEIMAREPHPDAKPLGAFALAEHSFRAGRD